MAEGYVPTQGHEILVDTPDSAGGHLEVDDRADLVSWLETRLDAWEIWRNAQYADRWKEYWTKVRGVWDGADRTRRSERSRIITPALAQAYEMTVSEIEEAMFSRELWIDVDESVAAGNDPQAMLLAQQARDTLLEDIELANGKEAVIEGVQNAAVFGLGVLKVCPEIRQVGGPKRDEKTGNLVDGSRPQLSVYWEAPRADETLWEPSARNVEDSLGMAFRMRKPMHSVLEKIEAGVYLRTALADLGAPPPETGSAVDAAELRAISEADMSDSVLVDEYHGKVPAKFLLANQPVASEADALLREDVADRPDEGDGPLVEAIITIANKTTLLRAIANPYIMKDRSVIAWPHEKVPGQMVGRGVVEKGINAQRALDAEVRARIDALGFVSAPMLAIDNAKMLPGWKREVFPGKIFTTVGPPGEAVQALKIGSLDGNTFNQASEMERMVQMATGAFDTGSALGRGQTASGGNAVNAGSLFMGAFVKRSKRSIQSLCRNAIQPLIQKTLWRYMEFDSQRYPQMFPFVIKTSLGIVAREVEQLNLTQLMAMLPDTAPEVKVAIAKGVIELANVHNRGEIMAVMDRAMQPDPQQQRVAVATQKIQLETAVAELNKLKAQVELLMAQAQEATTESAVNAARASDAHARTLIEGEKLNIARTETDQFARQTDLAEDRLALDRQKLNLAERKST